MKILLPILVVLTPFSLIGQVTEKMKTEADSLYSVATMAFNTGKYEDCIPIFNNLSAVFLEMRDTNRYMESFNFISISYHSIDEYSKSIAVCKKSLNFSKKYNLNIWTADFLGTIGYVENRMGNTENAIAFYDSSLSYALLGNDPHRVAIAYNNMGSWNQNVGAFKKAMVYYNKAYHIWRIQKNEEYLSYCIGNIAVLYANQSELEKAAQLLEENLSYFEKVNSEIDQCITSFNLGIIYGRMGEKNKEKAILEQCMRIANKNNYSYQEAIASANLGISFLDTSEPDSAKFYLEKGVSIFQKIGSKTNENLYKLAISNVYMKQNRWRTAYELISSLTTYFLNDNKSSQGRLKLLNNLTIISKNIGIDSSRYWFNKFYSQAETDIREFFRLQQKSASLYDFSKFYLEVATWSISPPHSDTQLVFKLLESSKGKKLVDDLNLALYNFDQNVDQNLLGLKKSLYKKIQSLQLKLNSVNTDSSKKVIESELRQLEWDYDALTSKMKLENPSFAKFGYPEPITLNQAQQLCDEKTAILEYAFSDSALIGFAITKDSVKPWLVEKTGSGVNGSIAVSEKTRVLLDSINTKASKTAIHALSQELSNYLLLPADSLLKNKTKLIIVPDGALAYLPFETLKYKSKYLIESFDIAYTPSLTALTLISKPKGNYEKDVFIVSNPDYEPTARAYQDEFRGSELYIESAQRNADKFRGLSTEMENKNTSGKIVFFTPLPETETEGKEIASLFSNPVHLTENRATEVNLKKEDLSQYRFIHFATHGIMNENKPELSGLVLAQNDTTTAGKEEDGYMRASEIYTMKLNAEMVTLSACKTGLGKNIRGEGVLGLQRAFFYAGASNVVVSLWGVSDKSTSVLMSDFYKSVVAQDKKWYDIVLDYVFFRDKKPNKVSKPKAMREAKLKLIRSAEYSHPFYWAPFIVIGN